MMLLVGIDCGIRDSGKFKPGNQAIGYGGFSNASGALCAGDETLFYGGGLGTAFGHVVVNSKSFVSRSLVVSVRVLNVAKAAGR
jgi:hypothetical protein